MTSSRRRAPGTWCSRAPRRTPRATLPCPAAGWCASRPCSQAWGSSGRGTRIGAAWARTLDHVAPARPEPRPAPVPPVAARPRELSVSDVGLWMKDPYDLYAKRILELAPLEALEADPGALERGNVIHKALERFVRAYPGRAADGRRAPPARYRARAVRGVQPPPAGHGAVVAALRAGRRLGDRAGARAPRGRRRDQGGGQGAAPAPGAGRRVPAQGACGSPRAACGRPHHRDRLQDRAPARARRGGLRARAPAAARGRDGRGRSLRRGRARGRGRAPVLAAARRRVRRRREARGRPRPRRARRPGARRTVPADRALRPAARPPIGRAPGPTSPGGATTTIWRGAANGPCEPARRSPPAAAHGRAAPRGRADLLDLGDRLGRHRQDAGAGGSGAAPAARRQRSGPAAVPDLHQGGGGRDGGAGPAGARPAGHRARRSSWKRISRICSAAPPPPRSGRARAPCSPRSSTCPPACRS